MTSTSRARSVATGRGKTCHCLQSHLAILREELAPRELLTALWRGQGWPAPDGRVMDMRRSVLAPREWLQASVLDERRGNLEGGPLRARRLARRPTDALWGQKLAAMMADVEQLQAAGVRVIFLRMPSGGPVRAIEEELYPRSEYWGRLERACDELGCQSLHFADCPELTGFVPPDGSHICAEERAAFSEALCDRLDVLVRRPEVRLASESGASAAGT